VLATGNRDKVRELQALFAGLPLTDVVAATELGEVPEVVEDGKTLAANALKKAREISAWCGGLCVADDTGLEVDALDGAPGVYAARFAGPDATYDDNCEKLLRALEGVAEERRTARFRTVMAVVDPAQRAPVGGAWESTVEGVLEGRILTQRRGAGGFGYDPVFFVPAVDLSLAEMALEEKNRISHRARASRAMLELLGRHLRSAIP
jgi:XTP/dITP diphosphohydrolase